VYRIRLTDEQRRQLKRQTRAPRTAARTRDRLEMVRLSHLGLSIPQIAAHLQTDPKTVRQWVKRFLEHGFGALQDQPHPGRRSQLTSERVEAIRALLAKGGRTWSAGQLAHWLAEQHQVRLHPQHLGRMLRRAKISYKRTHRTLKHKQNPADVAEKEADLRTLEKGETPAASTFAT
jgi:transposase